MSNRRQSDAFCYQGMEYVYESHAEWLDSVYLPTNLSRLRKCYKYVAAELIKRDILPHPAEATYFVWADITKVTDPATGQPW